MDEKRSIVSLLAASSSEPTTAAYKSRPESRIPETNWAGPWDQRTAFSRFARELDEGFSLLFYGFGSKRALLNTLAVETLASSGTRRPA
ncbi:hypothetical protein BJ138DRAFT_1119675 [Hygrophoropsis aurantiaca]|uniref:Uncharacterized protein n=1 Tax=Hygrophoropsis aurantiaca TaxID=72124 RepID=A0ACB7ZTZ0_9AGAM|nr:hypothetical protein BJ138DRAFT_1119675 [Hygrophoropsis aurantiaca]